MALCGRISPAPHYKTVRCAGKLITVITMCESLQALFWRCWHTHKFLFVWVTQPFWQTFSESECHQLGWYSIILPIQHRKLQCCI